MYQHLMSLTVIERKDGILRSISLKFNRYRRNHSIDRRNESSHLVIQ